MTEDRFDSWLRDAIHSYHEPPEPPLDAMWAAVEPTIAAGAQQHGRSQRWLRPLMLAAACLVIGVGIGRFALPRPGTDATARASRPASANSGSTLASRDNGPMSRVPPALQPTTDAYLSQTAALLVALPEKSARATVADPQLARRASELLVTTRLLLDSPAASDPALRNLLDDLELVLAQIARLPDERQHQELDLIHQAVEQREVMPRLRHAVADISADND